MRLAVMGAGGIGGYYGGVLAKAGEDVTFIARGAHLTGMRENGLTVKSPVVGDFTIPVNALDDPAKMGPVDLVLFSVKTYDTHGAAELIRPIVGQDTVVFSLQNGIDNREQIGRVVGPQSVMCGVTAISSEVESPGVVAHLGSGTSITFGEVNGDSTTRTQLLLDVFQCQGIGAQGSSNILTDLWEKYLWICGLGGVTALTRLSAGPILACEETKAFLHGTLKEVGQLALASGITMPKDCVDQWMAYIEDLPPSTKGSIAYDLAAGRKLELDTLSGTVVRLGLEHGIPTPFNLAIYAALKPYAEGTPAMP